MKKLIAAVALTITAATAVFAQDFKTSLFLDDYVYSYRLNPAAPGEGESTFIAFGIGNTSLSVLSNLGYSKIAFPVGGELLWGFDDAVPSDQFISGLDDDNSFQPMLNYNLFTFGRQDAESRFAIELNLRSSSYVGVSKTIASEIKHGMTEGVHNQTGTYSFSNWPGVETNNYAEVAFNYSHNIGDRFVIGATAKGLLGLAGGKFWINRVQAGPDAADDLAADVDADLLIATPMVEFGSSKYMGMDIYDFQNRKFGKLGLGGFGAAVDLGASMEVIDGLTVGLSVMDLGFMKWNYNIHGKMDYKGKKIKKEDDVYELQIKDPESGTTMLDYNVHLTAKYYLPFYDKLNVGLVGTYQKHFQEVRLGAGIKPLDWVSLALSTAVNNFGFDVGAGVNLRLSKIDFFLGVDSVYFQMSPQLLPIHRDLTNVTAGLAFAF